MALAILELIDADETTVSFRIDTGTNTQYQLKIGRDVREDDGNNWVDDVYYTTPASRVDGGAGFFAAPLEISVPLKNIEHRRSFAQLVSSKAGGKARTYSEVIALPGAAFLQPQSVAGSMSRSCSGEPQVRALQPHKAARQVTNRTGPLSHQASIESLLGEIVKIASPIVLNLLKDNTLPGGAAPPAGVGSGTTPPSATTDTLMQILKSILGAIASPGAAPAVSLPKSLLAGDDNRFSPGSTATFAKPFIFGIDDVLLASLVGPVLQVLPQLVNAANQKRIEFKKADTALMGGIVSDINKRMMMDKLIEAQRTAQAQGPAAPVSEEQLQTLLALLGQLPPQAAAAAPVVPAEGIAPLAVSKSFSIEPPPPPHDLSAKALLGFAFSNQVEWNGSPRPVFDKARPLTLKPRFTVIEPAPKAPLPKAILKLALYDAANPATRYEKIFKLKDVLANSAMECRFEPGELSHLPANCLLSVIGELRWKNARSGREIRALGSSEIVLVNKYFIKVRGAETSADRELKEMAQFRPFWNKIWEAPVLDGARNGNGNGNGNGRAKSVWDLNVNARYTTLLTAGHDSNGVMETKFLTETDDPERTTLSVHGRMKAGIELSLAELNKLIVLWNGPPTLDAEKLEALSARSFLDGAAREFKYNFKLKGRAGQAGMIWVVPVFKLFSLTLSNVVAADDSGQVTTTSEVDVQFPLPVAARLIGLKAAS